MINAKENEENATSYGNSYKVFLVEAFYGGSHKYLIDTLQKNISSCTVVTMTNKKWHWRARCSALILANCIPRVTNEKVLFTSSVVNLAELLGIRSDLQHLKKIVYFHENQLIYPVKLIKERDIQYAYNQIITCLAADVILFNSNFNKESFLSKISEVVKILPDYRPTNLRQKIEPKCKVLYFPIDFPLLTSVKPIPAILSIVWPHRWEFDKNPESLFRVLFKLKENNKQFLVSILGEVFTEVPHIFLEARERLQTEIINFGYIEEKQDYFQILSTTDIALSTANHEFYGVSIKFQYVNFFLLYIAEYLEATYAGCFPLVPNKLVYPEIYSKECLYSNEEELYDKLSRYCANPAMALEDRKKLNIDFDLYSTKTLLPQYLNIFNS